jgi:hypothetical protein
MSDNSARLVPKRRDLPARASLEHLRNEAKAHLRALRKERPGGGLAEATALTQIGATRTGTHHSIASARAALFYIQQNS